MIIAGVACSQERIFVLLDLPQVVLLEMNANGDFRHVWTGGRRVRGRHMRHLDAVIRSGEMCFYTIAEKAGSRVLVEATLGLANVER